MPNNTIGVFVGRKTYITIDDYPPSVLQSWTAIQRPFTEMARSAQSEMTNLVKIPGIGIRLRAYNLDFANTREMTVTQAGILSAAAGKLQIPAELLESDTFRQLNELIGVTYNAAVQAVGAPFVRKAIEAGASWLSTLAGDGAFTSPEPSEDSTPMDRVAKTTFSHKPWDAVEVNFSYLVGGTEAKSTLFNFYFCGPAGVDQEAIEYESSHLGDADADKKYGRGQYCLKVRGAGKAKLYERLRDNIWKFRFAFQWASDAAPGLRIATIYVISDSYEDEFGNFVGSRITIGSVVADDATKVGSIIRMSAAIASNAIASQAGMLPIYEVPRLADAPTQLAPLRLDIAREVRADFMIAKHIYPESGVLYDDVISFDQPITTDEPLWIYWKAITPTGTTLTTQVYDPETGAELIAAGDPETNRRITYQPFNPSTSGRQRFLRVKITFTSNTERDRGPTLQDIGVYRLPIYQEDSPLTPVEIPYQLAAPALPQQAISSLAINQQENDPSTETAHVQINDMTGFLEQLEDGQMRPFHIEVEDALGDRMTLFRGYGETAEADPHRTSSTRAWPSKEWRTFDCNLVGEWARLHEAIVERRFPWVDQAQGLPFKITDVVRTLLCTVYPPSMVSVPDIDLRLFSADGDAHISEIGTRVLDASRSYAEDYLGAYLIPDASAGTRFKWRMLDPKTPPYNNLVIFEIDKPTGRTLPHFSPAYGQTLLVDHYATNTFIQAGTYRERIQRAEGNCVMTYGSAIAENANKAGAGSAGLLTQFAVKVDSFNFLNLPNTHDYYPDGTSREYYGRIVPIKVVDWSLNTQEAADWKTRRVFDRTCWARKWATFTAPLVSVWDATDAEQVRARPLRYYDAVLVRRPDGSLEQFLVVGCNPTYVKDHIQMAQYTLVTQGNINTIGTMPMSRARIRGLQKALARLHGTDIHSSGHLSSQKGGAAYHSILAGLPESVSLPLQDLDPDSDTFGQFFYVPDYDPVDGGGPIR